MAASSETTILAISDLPSSDPVIKNELLELASVCEEVARNIEAHLTAGSWSPKWPGPNGKRNP